MKTITSNIAGVIVGLLILSFSAFGQDRVEGYVYDEIGDPVPGIQVELFEAGISTTTVGDGYYNFEITAPLCDQILTLLVNPQTSVQYYEHCNGGIQTVNIFLVSERAPLMVTNTDDSGPGSLRQAILDANSNPGKDYIHFDVPDIWMATIRPLSELPAISEEVEINGFSQPGSRMNSNPAGTGFNTSLQVVLDGVNAGPGAEGLVIAADGCTISGIVFTRFAYSGIALTADNNLVSECFIGTDSTGYQYQDNGNDIYGIRIYGANNNEIRSCVISGNGESDSSPNIAIAGGSSQNRLFGNLVGTDISGTSPVVNTARSIGLGEATDNVIGGLSDEDRNILFGGMTIIGTTATGNKVIGNYIGPDVTGEYALGTGGGIIVSNGASNNEIGPGNVISGNPIYGVTLRDNQTNNNRVFGNYFGVAADGNKVMGNNSNNVVIIGAWYNRIGGLSPDSSNIIAGSGGNGIAIDALSHYNVIVGNRIGTNASGSIAVGNQNVGIVVSGSENTIGPGNLISGNAGSGISIGNAGGIKVINNLIGVNATNDSVMPNGGYGISIGGGTFHEIEGNTICGSSQDGIFLAGVQTQYNSIISNYIGTNEKSLTGFGNDNGIRMINGGRDTVRNNIISGNREHGIHLSGLDPNGNSITGNKIGTTVDGMTALANGNDGIYMEGGRNTTIGGSNGEGNLISGNHVGINMMTSRPSQAVILGNMIGTNATGTAAIPNLEGIRLQDPTDITIGGPALGNRNIISGNTGPGIWIFGPVTNTVVSNNYIGTDLTGELPIPNNIGIRMELGAEGNYIGGGTNGPGNLIAYNTTMGLSLDSDHNYVLGNVIRGNGDSGSDGGISVAGSQNTIGGSTDLDRNYLYGNRNGMYLTAEAENNLIEGNYFGTDEEGLEDLTDANTGIWVFGSDNIVRNNLISGFSGSGIHISRTDPKTPSSRNWIEGNTIGLNASGDGFIPNRYGISIDSADNNTVLNNVIAGNTDNGITIFDDRAINNRISLNSIYSNGDLGIDLIYGSLGVTENDIDPFDPDVGANNLQNFPDLEYIHFAGGNVTISGSLRSESNSEYILEFFSSNLADASGYGEGETYLGSDTVFTDGLGNALFETTLPIQAYDAQVFTSTATDLNGNTSEFSQAIFGVNNLVVTNTNDTGEGSLRNAIEVANSRPGMDEILFNIPGEWVHTIAPTSMLPTVVDPLIINGLSQSGSAANSNSPGLGFNTTPLILLDGTNAGDPASGLIIHTDSCNITGLIISQFSNRGIALWGNHNTVSDCFIGTDSLGNSSLDYGNKVTGIEIESADNNVVHNCIISANGGDEPNPGISIHSGSTLNQITGNLIGTDISGLLATPNSGGGIGIINSSGNTIGGPNIEDRNIIFGGVALAQGVSGTRIIGNYLGLDVTGLDTLGSGGGISMYGGANDNEVGPGNIISGIEGFGIYIIDSITSNNRVFGNYLGLAADGNTPLGNESNNIQIENSPNNRIGGLTADSANVISASINDHGILLTGPSTTGNSIVGNLIGTNAAGDQALGNLWQGVAINNDAAYNVIGPGNLISGNSGFGIKIEAGTPHHNKILSNLIGTTANGEQLLSNRDDGVHIHNSYGNAIDGNIICGAGIGSVGNNGIEIYGIDAHSNTILNNYIGTNAASGLNLGNGFNGVHIAREAHHNSVGPNNFICSNYGSGIRIDSEETVSADSNLVFQNYIGTDLNGNTDLGNGAHGIEIRGNSKITTIGPNNIIAGNTYDGIHLENAGTTGTVIFQNIIGTNTLNSSEIGNGSMGILLDDSVKNTTIGPGNVVSGNGMVGIELLNGSSDNTLIGNRVGTTINGMDALGNEGIGVMILDSPNNLIGGTEPEDRNLLSGNGMEGLAITFAGSSGNRVIGNYIGTDATGQGLLQNGSGDFGINAAPNNMIGGLNPGERNVIASMAIGNSGANWNNVVGNFIGIRADGTGPLSEVYYGAGVFIGETSDNTIGPGNVISGLDHGVYIHVRPGGEPDSTARNKIIGNYIGTNPDGSSEIPNRVGIFIEGATSTAIGGISYGERNIISGSKDFGIQLDGPATDTHIENNYIGTDKDGTQQIPNREGISIGPNSYNNYIGNGTYEGRNLIAFNTSAGIGLGGEENYVLGNWIHDVQTWGIYVVGNNNVIGGALEESGNYIWGENNGIQIFPDIEGTRIEGNVLGTDLEGKEDMTEGWNGIAISGLNTIIKDNVICGFEHHGIHLPRWDDNSTIPSGNQITGNIIGLAPNGENFIPNGHGISLNSASDNIISENIIAGNQNHGITINDNIGAQSQGNLISQNNIYSNGGIGIDLLSDWVTENDIDPLDPDEGPNHLQNFPVLDSISFGDGNVTVGGFLRSRRDTLYIIEFFSSGIGDDLGYGEGEFYLGCDTVMTNDTGYVYFVATLPTKGYGAQVISATTTDLYGNTSEFSQVIGGVVNQVLPEMPFIYTLNSEGLSTVPLADYQDAIRSAFQTWSDVPTAEIQMDEAEVSSDEKYASAKDGINLVSFQDDRFPFAKGVLAVTAKTLRITSGGTAAEILDADIVFNPAYIHDPVRPFAVLAEGDTTTTAFDIQTVATHEIGHVLGMIHSGVYSSTMFFMLGYGTTERELDQDDIAWASYRYPNEDFQSNYGLISGRVTYGDLGDVNNPSTHPPVAGALVLSVNNEGQPISHAYTDAEGNYTVPIPINGVLSDECYIHIQPLDGDVFGTPLTPANISPYIYSHTIFTDFPNEFYDDQEGADEDGNPGDVIPVAAGGEITGIDLITNKDETPPRVLGTSLDVKSVDVPVSPTVAIKFSEPVDIYSFDENSCYFEGSGVILGGEYTLLADSTHIVLMKPVESLQYSADYTLVINGVTDLKGNTMETAYTSDFTTRDPDTEAPWVYDVIPADGLSQVDVTKPVKIFFSEPMDKLSVETGFSLMNSESLLVTGDYKWDLTNKEMTLYPDFSLEEGTDYVINITTQAMDLSGNPMENQAIFTFSTVDVAAPQILYLGPADRSTGITMETPVVVKMSEPLDLTTITSNSFFLADSVTAVKVNGTYEYLDDDRTIIFRPDQSLSFDQPYTITLKSAISDLSNPKQYLEDTTTSFRTAPYIVVPHITYMEPPFGAEGAQTTIVGSGFDPQPLNNIVMFNGSAATVKKATLQSLTVNVPYLAYDGPVTVTVNGVASDNSFEFDVVPPNTDPSYSVIASSKTGSNTRAVVINPDAAYAYVTNWGDNTVTPIDLSGNTPVPEENIPVGVEPMDIDLNPAGTLAYVTNYLSNTVSVIGTDIGVDATYHKVAKTIPVGYHPYGVAASSDKLVYVANNESEYVSVIDVDPNSGGFDHVIANVTTGTKNRSIVVTPDAGLILVTGDNGVIIIDRDPGSDTFNDVIATASSGSTTRHVTITPDAALALATTEDGVILIIDIFQPAGTQFGSVIASVKTGSSARNVTISPDAMYVYITNPDDNTVSVYQLDYSIIPGYGASLNNPLGLLHVTTIEVGNTPYAIAGHPSSEYFLVTHDSEEGGVSKVGVKEESVNVIYTLGELISSVENALKDGDLTGKIGGKLLVDLQKTKDRINSGQLESAIDHLDNFISRVHKWISTGEIEEDLGNAWLEAAYRIRDQLLKDLEEQQSLLKGSGVPDPEIRTLNDRQNSISNQGDLRPGSTLKLENRPNPFSYHTQVYFEIPENGQADVPVVIRVFNINGQVIKTLVHQDMKAGRYMLNWNCDLDDGGLVQDGIYLLELMTPNERETIRISVIK